MTLQSLQPPQREAELPGRSSAQWRTSAAIFGVAMIMRLGVIWMVLTSRPHNWLYTKGIEMGLLAASLVHGQGYSSPFGMPTGPTAFIAPGYPTLVAGVFLLFGTYSYASAIVIMMLQLAIALLTIWLIMYICREVFDQQTANVAGWFWAVSLPVIWLPTVFWETSISACALPAMIVFAIRSGDRPTKTTWALYGAYCAIIGLINPALLSSLLAILGWMAWRSRRASKTAPLVGVLALILVFAAWPIRNAYRFHAFIPLRSTVGFELWMGNRPGANGFLDVSLFPTYDKQELASYLAKGEVAYSHDKAMQAWEYVRAHPGIFLRMTARRMFAFWTGTLNPGGSPAWGVHVVLTTGLGFTGLFLLYRRRKRAFACLMAMPLLLFPLPYYITHAEFRYRLNIDPLLTILGAYAVTQLYAMWLRRQSAIQAQAAGSSRD